jgi:hypothetical protein
LTQRTQKPTRRPSQKTSNPKSASKEKPTKSAKPLKSLLRQKDTPEKAITVDSSSPPPSEPEVVFLYYIVIWKARVGEVDIASTSTQRIISGEFLRKVDSWINEVKAN